MSLATWAGRSALAGLGAGLIAAAGLFRRSLPRVDGRLAVRGIRGPLEIGRDHWGVPHIQAGCLADAFFALGYAHAQDRPFQMEMHRRIASGTLAEMVGERGLPIDRIARYVGFRRLAEGDLGALDGEAVDLLSAYTAGVNAVLLSPACRPIEVVLIRHRLERWEPINSLAWARFLGWALSFNYQTEYLRYRLLRSVGPEVAAAVEPAPAAGHPASVTPGSPGCDSPGFGAADFLAAAALLDLASGGGASNAWAVTGERSATGRPLLANDPHLPPQCPPIWYEAHLTCPGMDVAGATTPGAPGVIIGHNDRIAWGVTVAFLDTQDLYAERQHPDGSPRYEVDGRWEPARVVREEIRVRGRGQPVVEKVHITRHGPIITPILAGEPQPLSLRTAADPPARALRSTLRVSTARDWSEFDAALAGWPIGGLNFVYADVDGHVGLRVAGRVPDRAGGTGIAPAPGWDSRRDWAGLLPDAVLPRIVDPPAGWVVTANNRPGGPSDGLLSREWPDGYRAQRIEAMLGEAAPHDAASFARMQTDLTSCAAQQLTPLLLATSPASPRDARALAMLRGWDCVVAANSAAAAVYEAWRLALLRRVFACVGVDEVDHQMGLGYIAFSNSNHNQIRLTSKLIGLLAARPAPWPAADNPPGLDWDAALSASLSDAVEDLERRLGPEPTSWAWGRLHTITFEHPLGVGLLKRVLSVGPIPSGGDAETICQSALDPRNPLTRSRSAVSYRFIADVSDWDRCLSALPTGQSGNPASAHYRDQSALWRAGRHHPMPFSPDAVRQATRHKIILMPVREGA